MTDLRLPQHSLPGFEDLVNGDLWSRWASDGRVPPLECAREAVRYLRLKPDHSCRLVVDGSSAPTSLDDSDAESPADRFLVLFHPDTQRSQELYDKLAKRPAFTVEGGPEPFLDAGAAAIVLPYPNDPDLPALRHVHEPDRYRRTIGELLPGFDAERERIKRRSIHSTLLAYKPGRRSVYRTRFEVRSREGDSRTPHDWHVQVERPESAVRNSKKAGAIAEAAANCDELRVGAPLGCDRDRGLIATRWIPGASLAEHLAGQVASDDALDASELVTAFAALGEQLAELHALDADLEHVASPIEEIDALGALADDLVHLLPDRADGIRDLADRLFAVVRTLSVEPSAIVHGDLHPAQVIIASATPEQDVASRVAIVDFDRAGRGYARLDLASLVAHLEDPEHVRALLDGYATRAGESIEPRGLVAIARFRRCFEPFRALQPDWPEATVARLQEVEADLEAHGG